MYILRRATPVAVVIAVVAIVTAILWLFRILAVGPQHLVFFYLLPIALFAMLYGITATLCAAFFLYEPLYSFYVTSPLDIGELVWFVALALISAKCAADLLQPLSLPRENAASDE